MNRSIDIKELKRIQLEMLNALKDYCDKKGLSYYLAYGTLLGAVRHKGYIPWDDDIDVMIPREDYDILIDTFNRDAGFSDIKLVSHEIDSYYYLSFAKLINTRTVMQEDVNSDYQIGVYIDIFPLDNLSDNYDSAKKRIKKAIVYNEIMLFKNLTFNRERSWYKNAILRVGRLLSAIWTRDRLIKKLNSFSIKTSDESFTRYVGTVTGISAKDGNAVFESKWFKEAVTVEFEGEKYKAPVGYDAILGTIYGDYMKLPPIEEQVTHHAFNAWYTK